MNHRPPDLHPFTERVLRTIRSGKLVEAGHRVIAAVSGGPDSVAMLCALKEASAEGGFAVVAVAHFNHRLRGDDADADEAFCRELAAEMGLPFECGTTDVRQLASSEGRSMEDAARTARYTWLNDVADRLSADRVAVGHTEDDQAETVLLKMFRGAGPRGLGGIYPRNGRIVRPLLNVSRQEVLAFLSERNRSFRVDASNADRSIRRNWLRLEVLPAIERVFGPVAERVAKSAALCREDADWLDTETVRLAVQMLRSTPAGVEVHGSELAALPAALARRVARIALQWAGGRFIGFDQVAALLACAAGEGPAGFDLPGQRVRRVHGVIRLAPRGVAQITTAEIGRLTLAVPGEVVTSGWKVDAALAEPSAAWLRVKGHALRGWALSDGQAEAYVDSLSVPRPLTVRSRLPGDRLKPFGGLGRRKLQDLLVDRKVPRAERNGLPLVVDADDRIVWVPGCAIGHDFRVTTNTQAVIILKAKRLGGT